MPAPLILLNNPGCREKEKHHNIQYCIKLMAIKAKQAHHPLTAEDRYREGYFEAVDKMISSIRERFKQPSFEAYENMESLIVKTIAPEDTSKEPS